MENQLRDITSTIGRIEAKTDSIDTKVDVHSECLATLVERSSQHEKRMDRTEKKAAGLGAASGFLASWAVPIARWFGMSI